MVFCQVCHWVRDVGEGVCGGVRPENRRVEAKTSVKMANMSLLSAAFVALLHSGFTGITYTAVPFFFFAAGFFLAGNMCGEGWWKREVGKRVRSLLVPMWVWGVIAEVIAILLVFIRKWIGCAGEGSEVTYAYRAIRAAGLLFTDHMGVYWFLRTLFVYVLLSPLLIVGRERLSPKERFICLVGRIAVIMALLHACRFSTSNYIWFCSGIFFRTHPLKVSIPKGVFGLLVLLSAALAIASVVQDWGRCYNYLSIPIWMVTLYELMPFNRVYLKGYSFPIYLIHMSLLSVINTVFAALGVNWTGHVPISILVVRFMFAFYGSVALAFLLRKCLPRFAKVAFGGR